MPIDVRDFVTPAWLLIGLGLVLGGGVGLYEVFAGHLFATNDAMVWTLPLVTYVFLALTSTGVSLMLAYGLISRTPVIVAQTRTLLIIAIGLLFGAFTALATELGSLLNMIWLLLSPNTSSPIWWMGTLYAIELVLLLGKLALDLAGRHGRFDEPLAWATLIVAGAAATTIGAVFGTVDGRADFRGAFSSVMTLISALVGGSAMLVLLRPEAALSEAAGKFLRIVTILFAVLLAARYTEELLSSTTGLVGWASIWMPALFLVVAVGMDHAPRSLAALALIGTLGVHYSFIITGQLVSLGPKASWFGAMQQFRPNLAELLILVLGIAVAAALIKLGRQLLIDRRGGVAEP